MSTGVAADLRLVGFALGMWGASLLALRVPAGAAVGLAVAGALVAGAAALVHRRTRRQADRARHQRRANASHRVRGAAVVLAVVGALLGVVCGLLSTAARTASRDAEPLADLARSRAAVLAELTVTDDPRPLAGGGPGPPTYLIPATLTRLDAGTQDVRLDARVLVFATVPEWRDLLPSQRVSTAGTLAGSRGGDLTAAVLTATGPLTTVDSPSWTQRAAGRLRAGLQAACRQLPPAPGGLLPGLVIGDTSRLDPALADQFRTTGLTHLVAVSGANVAILLGVVLFAARWCRAGPWLSVGVCALALAGFVILARPSPSVIRAAAMGSVALLALATGRSRAAMPALAAAVVVGLLIDPALAVDAGFTLSVLATGALVLLAPSWSDWLADRGIPRGLAEALAVPAAAQVVCGPVIVALSGQVSLVAVPANMLAAPAVAPATLLGVAAALVSPLWSDGASLLAWLAAWPARWLVAIATTGAAVPDGTIPWPGGAWGGLGLAGLTAGLLVAGRRPVVRRLLLAGALAVAVGAVPVRLLASGWPPANAVIVACDVGQGDALVLPDGPDDAVVVDTGPEPAAVAACLHRLGIHRVSALILTHFHVDHVGGVTGVFDGHQVAGVVLPAFHEPDTGYRAVLDAAARHQVSVTEAAAGWTLLRGGLELRAIGPTRTLTGTRSDPNNNSLVLRATSHGVSVLLEGDAETEEQGELLADDDRSDLRADVLKVAHHGSAYQDPALLETVHPSVALVSVGAGNPYGHPNAGLLAALTRDGVRVLRTDQDGDVAVVATDHGLAVVQARSPPTGFQLDRWPSRVVRPPVRGASHSHLRWPSGDTSGNSKTMGDWRRPCEYGGMAASGAPRLVLGDEELLVTRGVAAALADARASDPDTSMEEYAASEMTVSELLAAVSPSLFGGGRVVVIRDSQDAKKDLAAAILSYAASPEPDITLVVTHAGGAKGKALADGLRDCGASVVNAGKLTRVRERVEFVRDEIRRLGGKANDDAAEALIDAVGNDLRELAAACAQLVADTGGRIDRATVARYYRGRAAVSGFTVADAAMVGDLPGALEALRWALQIGVDPVPIADALADGVRTVARVASAGRGNSYQLASSLGLPPWKIERAQKQSRGWSAERLAEATRVTAECNAAVKGGSDDRGYALEQAVFALVAARTAGDQR